MSDVLVARVYWFIAVAEIYCDEAAVLNEAATIEKENEEEDIDNGEISDGMIQVLISKYGRGKKNYCAECGSALNPTDVSCECTHLQANQTHTGGQTHTEAGAGGDAGRHEIEDAEDRGSSESEEDYLLEGELLAWQEQGN
jgi:hypothetical protein